MLSLAAAVAIGTAFAQQAEEATAPPAPPAPATFVAPTVISFVEAPYPPGIDRGEVHVPLLLLVGTEGAVERVEAEGGDEPFRSAAVAAAQQIRFSPATEDGVSVAVELPLDFLFPTPPVNLGVRVSLAGIAESPGVLRVLVDDVEYQTGIDGVLELRNVAPGSHSVRLVHDALVASPATVVIASGERVDVAITARALADDDTLLGVYRRRHPATIERTVTAEEVRTTPGTMGDPIRAIQNLPGVVRTPLDAGWLLVRGGDPEDTGLFIDGIRVPLIYHLGGYTSVLHPRAVDKITFMPSGYDARYGRATAGAVELETKRLGGGPVQSQVGIDLVSSGAYLEVPTGADAGVALAVRRSYLDTILQSLPSITEEQAQVAPRFWDFMLRADDGPVGLLVFGFADEIDAPSGIDDGTVTVTIGTIRAHGRYDFHLFGRPFRLSPMWAHDWRAIDVTGVPDLQQSTVGGGRLETFDDGTGTVGTSGGLDLEGGWFGTQVSGVNVEGHYASLDPYAAIRVGTDTSVTAGLRAETLLVEGQDLRIAPSPRLDFTHPLTPSTRIVADFGLYHQFPPMDVAVALPGGPYLPLEESWGGGAGARTQWSVFDFEVDAYARRLTKTVVFEDDGSLGIGQGLAYGVETLTRYDVWRLSGWLSYTWSRSFRREEPDDLYEPHTYDQPHYLVVVSAFDLGRKWTVAGRWRFASGYPLQDASGAYDILTSTLERNLHTDANGRLGPFHALDIKISKEFVLRHWSLEAYLDVQNVYWRRVPEPAITGLTQQGTVYTYGLFTLPIFGVQGNFGPGHGSVSRP